MDEKQQKQLAQMLAEFVAWSGEEDHFATCKRFQRAERLLKKIAPDVLKAEKAKVPVD